MRLLRWMQASEIVALHHGSEGNVLIIGKSNVLTAA